jgi:hypothetical protein
MPDQRLLGTRVTRGDPMIVPFDRFVARTSTNESLEMVPQISLPTFVCGGGSQVRVTEVWVVEGQENGEGQEIACVDPNGLHMQDADSAGLELPTLFVN